MMYRLFSCLKAKMSDSPLLAAIAACKEGKQAPHWVPSYLSRSV